MENIKNLNITTIGSKDCITAHTVNLTSPPRKLSQNDINIIEKNLKKDSKISIQVVHGASSEAFNFANQIKDALKAKKYEVDENINSFIIPGPVDGCWVQIRPDIPNLVDIFVGNNRNPAS